MDRYVSLKIFWGCVGEKGKNKFGLWDETRSLQNSSWGKVGSSFNSF